MAKTVLHISAGQLTPYAGDYQYYLDKSKATSARAALTAGEKLHNLQPAAAPVANAYAGLGMKEMREKKRAEAEARKAIAKEKRDREKRVTDLEMQIATLEGRQRDLTAQLEDSAAYEAGGNAIALNRELSSVSKDLTRLNDEWMKAAADLSSDNGE